jgi:nucleoid-associated protein YgaU
MRAAQLRARAERARAIGAAALAGTPSISESTSIGAAVAGEQITTSEPALAGHDARIPSTSDELDDPDRSTWTVQRGQHLWGIAADVVRERSSADPDARAVADYWVELIEANRSRLVDPSNPDLIHPGLVLTLP